jgi:hypothetical protein
MKTKCCRNSRLAIDNSMFSSTGLKPFKSRSGEEFKRLSVEQPQGLFINCQKMGMAG